MHAIKSAAGLIVVTNWLLNDTNLESGETFVQLASWSRFTTEPGQQLKFKKFISRSLWATERLASPNYATTKNRAMLHRGGTWIYHFGAESQKVALHSWWMQSQHLNPAREGVEGWKSGSPDKGRLQQWFSKVGNKQLAVVNSTNINVYAPLEFTSSQFI